MADAATQPAPRLAVSQRRVVTVPDDLVALLTEDRIRKLNARVAAKLKALPTGGVLTIRLVAAPGGAVIDSHVFTEEQV